MKEFKKFNGTDWQTIQPKKYDLKEIFGTPPFSFESDGGVLQDWSMTGQTVQNGTPTPENPIMPSGCGEMETTGAHAGQYKLPILSNSTVTNIYLGEVETTRRIKKLVLDGTENWGIDSGRFTLIINDIKVQGLRLTEFYCSSYQVISDGRAYADVTNNAIYTGGGSSSGAYIYIHTDEYTTTTSYKAYLAQQLANGTPVTIWYPLKTPTTGILNEPLMKIGNYADEINLTNSGINIPTIEGSNTLTVNTTIQPSSMSIKKGLWKRCPLYEYTPYVSGVPPFTFKSDGQNLRNWSMTGQTVQDGMPTPENPIMPVGCGERVDITGLSEPLCGIKTYTDNLNLSTGILTRRIKKLVLTGTDAEGTWKASSTRTGSFYLNVGTNGIIEESICDRATNVKLLDDYHYGNIYAEKPGARLVINLWLFDTAITVEDFKAYLASEYSAGTPVTVWYVLAEPEVSTISIPSGLTGTVEGYLIQNDTPTPENPIYPTANGVKQADGTYSIPYGYKLPILSNSTVTNIYLGEVETTRRIKKVVLTGEENWVRATNGTFYSYFVTDYYNLEGRITICSHYIGDTNRSSTATVNDKACCFRISDTKTIYIRDTSFNSVTEFITYLAAQYAAGTPVTVWYVLAEPEAAVVNEPLMKIGDYADEISKTGTSMDIPTASGSNMLTVSTTVQPSEMTIESISQWIKQN